MDYRYKNLEEMKLARMIGHQNQQLFPIEPESPGPSSGVLIPFITSKYPGFGQTSNVYRKAKPKCDDVPGNTLYWENVFARRDKGHFTKHIQRSDHPDLYEVAKFHPSHLPWRNRPKQQHEWTQSQLEDYQLRHLTNNWPRVPHCPTDAPFIKSRLGWAFEAQAQPEGLTAVLAIPELSSCIMGHLMGHWESVSNLSRACQFTFQVAHDAFQHLDMASEETALREERMPKLRQTIMATQIRRVNHVDNKVSHRRRAGGPSEVEVLQPAYPTLFSNYLNLLEGIATSHLVLQNVILTRLPFLDVPGIRAILETCPNLRVLGVHNCDLLHFGQTQWLLETVAECNTKRREANKRLHLLLGGSESSSSSSSNDENDDMHQKDHRQQRSSKLPQPLVDLDFSPRYYQGTAQHGGQGALGSLWHDDGRGLDNLRGVVAHLAGCLGPLAERAGADLLSPGRGFRRWLDRLPFALGTLPHILEAVVNIRVHATRGLAAWTSGKAAPRDTGRKNHRRHRGRGRNNDDINNNNKRAVDEFGAVFTLWADLVVATEGRGAMQLNELKGDLGVDDRRGSSNNNNNNNTSSSCSSSTLVFASCGGCRARLPPYFFRPRLEQLGRRDEYRRCMGCQLSSYLTSAQEYDYQREKKLLADELWCGGRIGTVDLLMAHLGSCGVGGVGEDENGDGDDGAVVRAALERRACRVEKARRKAPSRIDKIRTAYEAARDECDQQISLGMPTTTTTKMPKRGGGGGGGNNKNKNQGGGGFAWTGDMLAHLLEQLELTRAEAGVAQRRLEEGSETCVSWLTRIREYQGNLADERGGPGPGLNHHARRGFYPIVNRTEFNRNTYVIPDEPLRFHESKLI